MPKAVGGWKVCSNCKEHKAVSEFSKDNSRADGLRYQCKVCQKTYRQSEAGIAARHRYERSDKCKVTNRAADQRYKQSNGGKATSTRVRHKRRALKANAISDLTPEDYAILDTLYPVCVYCSHEFIARHRLYKRTLEHFVPYSRGGQNTFDNVAFACQRCNSSKGTKLLEEWTNRWYEDETERRTGDTE